MVKYILALMLIALNTYAVRTEKEVFLFTNKVGIGSTNLPEQVLEVDGQGVFDSIALKGSTNLILSHYNDGISNYLAMIMEGTTTTNLYPLVTTEVVIPNEYDLQITWSTNLSHPVNGNYFVDGDNGDGYVLTNATSYDIEYVANASCEISNPGGYFASNGFAYFTNTYGAGVLNIVATSRVPVIIYGTNDWCGDYTEVFTNFNSQMMDWEISYYRKVGTPTWFLYENENDIQCRWILVTNNVDDLAQEEKYQLFNSIIVPTYGFFMDGVVLGNHAYLNNPNVQGWMAFPGVPLAEQIAVYQFTAETYDWTFDP